jgi:preprotein translocase SecE subunit
MIQFLKDSVREIKHVVWPTRKETQKYFLLVLATLIVFGIYLFIFSNIFSAVISGLRDIFVANSSESTQINSSITDEDIKIISDEADIDILLEETGTGSEASIGETLPESSSDDSAE